MEDTEIKAAADKLKAEVKTTIDTEVKAAVAAELTEVKTLAQKGIDDAAANDKEITRMATEMARVKSDGVNVEDGGTGAIRKALEQNADKLKAFAHGGKGRAAVDISDIKATITSSNFTAAGTPGVITPVRLPGIITQPERPEHVRDFIATATTNSNSIVYVRESSYTDGAAVTGEGALKPNSSLNLETKRADVTKIATYFKVSEEMLSDIPALLGYISARGTAKVLLVEDAQLMNGSGTGLNINGIRTQASAFTGGSLAGTIEAANNMDVLRASIAQIRAIEYQPTAVMMNPADVAAMELSKDAENRYLLPTLLTGTQPLIGRLPIVENTILAPGTFLVGDFQMGAQVFYREGISIRVYDQNEDDAIKNLVTIVIEERLALCVYRPEAFVKGTFATAKALLETA